MLTTGFTRIATSIASSVRQLIRDLPCFIFTAAVMPGFVFLDLLVWVLNPGDGRATTADQDFFINPLFGSLSHNEDVRLHDDAILPFSGYEGVTFGNHIYVNPRYRWASTAALPLLRDLDFRLSTKLVLHELTHVMQYKALNGSHAAFGWAYLKAFYNVRNATNHSTDRF